MSFDFKLINANMDEDRVDRFIDVYREWYYGDEYLEGLFSGGFGQFTQIYNAGGQSVEFNSANFGAYAQLNDGRLLGASGEGLEVLDDEFNLEEQNTEVPFSTGGFFEPAGESLIIDVAQIDTNSLLTITDYGDNYRQREEVAGVGGDFFNTIAQFSLPQFVNSVCYEPVNDRIYYIGVDVGTTTVDQRIGAIDLRGSPRGAPQEKWEKSLYNDRNYVGNGENAIWAYQDEDGPRLYTLDVTSINELNPETGRVIAVDRFGSEAPMAELSEYGMSQDDVNVDSKGRLHIHYDVAGVGSFDENTPEDRDVGIESEFTRYFVYDFLEQERVKSNRMYREYEAQSTVDIKTTFVNLSYPEVLFTVTTPDPYTKSRDVMRSAVPTPWGYVLTIMSDVLPRIEFYTHDDELVWRSYDGAFKENNAFNHRLRSVPSNREVYPSYQMMPHKWENDVPDIGFHCQRNIDYFPKIQTTQSTATWTSDAEISSLSNKISATTEVTQTSSFSALASSSDIVKIRNGVIGGAESVDGSEKADPVNGFVTDTDSNLFKQNSSVIGASTDTAITTRTSKITPFTITRNTDSNTVESSEENSSLSTVGVTVTNTLTESIGELVVQPETVNVDVLKQYQSNPWKRRAIGTGETTETNTTLD